MHTTRFMVLVAGIAMLAAACGEDRSPSGPDMSLGQSAAASSASTVRAKVDETPVTAAEACPDGLATETVAGVTACVHQTDFDVERCVTPEMLAGKSELVHKMGFVNASDLPLYDKPAFFHADIANCGAIDKNFGVATHAVAGFPIDPQAASIATWTFDLSGDLCGTYAFVDTVRNGEITVFDAMHYIINTGVDCAAPKPAPGPSPSPSPSPSASPPPCRVAFGGLAAC